MATHRSLMRVLVTGATRGLGRAITEAIAARGGEHIIYLGCRDMHRGAALAAALSCGSVQVVPVEIDVTKSATVAAAASTVAAACSSSPLDALVNNAGVLLERDGCDLPSIVEPTLIVNVGGVIAATESFLPLLREGGRIINVSSGAGTRATASLDDADRAALDAADVHTLQATILQLAQAAAALPREPGDTPIYGLSKAGVNFYTRLVARQAPAAWLRRAVLAAIGLATYGLLLTHNGPLGSTAELWPLGPCSAAPEPVRGAAEDAGFATVDPPGTGPPRQRVLSRLLPHRDCWAGRRLHCASAQGRRAGCGCRAQAALRRARFRHGPLLQGVLEARHAARSGAQRR